MAIPVIDFSKLEGEERPKTLAEIAHCCEEWGFFQLINHGIPVELLERVKKLSTEFFKSEREEGAVKRLNKMVETGCGQRLDNLDWEDVIVLLDDNQWPSSPSGFIKTMEEYRREVKKLGEEVMEVMDENLGLERGYIKRAFLGGADGDGKSYLGTKVSHYPPCPCPDLVSGLRAHTDAGGVILLFQDDTVGGLQILKEGKWIDVQPIPNAIVINTGDQIEVLSNGRYKSAWHRVLAFPDTTRRSIASFYNPSLKATIAPAPQLVQQEHNKTREPRYPKFVFGDYMDVYTQQKFLPKEPRFQAVALAAAV